MAPPHSYIDVNDFKSPKQLAEYLNYLDANPQEYMSYFWWKDYYRVERNYIYLKTSPICKLCEMLHDETVPVKSYDMQEWWIKGSNCSK